jgi:hypothetical protein
MGVIVHRGAKNLCFSACVDIAIPGSCVCRGSVESSSPACRKSLSSFGRRQCADISARWRRIGTFGAAISSNPLHSKQDSHGLRFADEGTAPQRHNSGARGKEGTLMFAHVLDCQARSGRSERVGSILAAYILRILQGQEGFVDFLVPSDASDHERFVCVS